ncbi:hypothetical protein JY651_26730 [Pyxidicoccus parkwayensis]|uniref:Uncharacterized protein n=1 Tax=Pyxidicoccus parkwayensis TaxID=2813578 RepID=A0ABX7NNA5_9BACT|nr:hypothetical protein [Pyxidicoccus parkwaysis]QSQ18949.1 hypothetical protein JY651_26730 [Pyxidicoccus parkwaysis]
MDRHLARTNPRLYAARWMAVDEEGHSALLRSLPPEELALHVEALLAALLQPPRVVGEGVLTLDIRVEALDAVGIAACYREDDGESRRHQLLEVGGLRPAEARAVLDALWSANTRLGGRPARTGVNSVCLAGLWGDDDPARQEDPAAFELVLCERQLGVLEALFTGLPLRRAELQGYEATYAWCLTRPDGLVVVDYSRPDPGYADLRLFWAAPDGGEAEAFFSSSMKDAAREALVAWSEKAVHSRGCPLWQRWQDPSAPSMLELPPEAPLP